MALPVEQAQRLLNNFRGQFETRFPRIKTLSDMDLARRLKSVNKDNRFDDFVGSNVLTRLAGRTNIALEEVGQRAEDAITSTGLPRGVGRGANFLIQSIPEVSLGLASSFLKGPSTALRVATMAIPAVVAGFRAGAETGERGHILGSALSVPVSFLGAEALARRFTKPLARAAAGMVGGAFGDLAEIGSHPGLGENPLERTVNFFSDPHNRLGYMIAQLPFAGVDYLVQKGQKVSQTVERRRAAIQPATSTVRTAGQADNFLKDHGINVPEAATSLLEPVRVRGAQMLQRGEITEAELQLRFLRQVPTAERPQEMAEYMTQLEGQVIEDKNFKDLKQTERKFSIDEPEPDQLFSLKTTVGDSFFQNNLLKEFHQATLPRVKGGKVLKPELIVRPEGQLTGKSTDFVRGKAVSHLLNRWATKELAELPGVIALKKELGSKNNIKVEELWQKFVDVMPEVEVRTLVPRQFGSYAEGLLGVESLPFNPEQLELKKDLDEFGFVFEYGELGQVKVFDGDPDEPGALVGFLRPDKEGLLSVTKTVSPENLTKLSSFGKIIFSLEPPADPAAVTGRYGNDPLPLDEMDRPVDILVKDPTVAGEIDKIKEDLIQATADLEKAKSEIEKQGAFGYYLGFDTFINKETNEEFSYSNPPIELNELVSDMNTKKDIVHDLTIKQANLPPPSFTDKHFDFGKYKEGAGIVVSVRGFFYDPDTFSVHEMQSTAGQERRKAVETYVKDKKKYVGRKLVSSENQQGGFGLLTRQGLIPEGVKGMEATETEIFLNEADQLGIKEGDVITKNLLKKLAGLESTLVSDHPLFSVYNKLGIKAAIKHAKDNEAKYIVFPDAETAMMTQGHDEKRLWKKFDSKKEAIKYAKDKGLRGADGPERGPGIPYPPEMNVVITEPTTENPGFKLTTVVKVDHLQAHEITKFRELGFTFLEEGGMKLNYDQDIPKEVRRLTKDKGKRVNLSSLDVPARTALYSKVFKESNGEGKFTASGTLYDITKIDPSEFRLFNLYDSANQSIAETQINQAVDEALLDSEYVTQEKFLNSVIPASLEKAGDKTALVLARWLGSIQTGGVALRTFNLEPLQGTTVRGFTEKLNQIGVNLDQTPERAYGTVGHEFSHTAMHELARRSPEDFKTIDGFVHEYLGQDGMKALLTDVQKLTKTEDLAFDVDYLTGLKFAQDDPEARLKTTYEFIAGVNELLTIHEYRQATVGRHTRLDSLLNMLPYPLQRQIRLVVDKLRQWFGPHYPSMAHVLGAEEQARVFKTLELMGNTITRNEIAQRKAYELLGNTDRFNPDALLESLPHGLLSLQEGTDPDITHLPADMRMYSKATINMRPPEGVGFGVKWGMSGLYRAQLYPFTRPIFESLHHFRQRIKERVMENVSILGRGAEGTKGLAEDNLQAQKILNKFSAPVKSARARRAKVGKVLHRNQELRAESQPILTEEQMRTEHGLSDEDVDFVNSMIKIPEVVAQQRLNDMIDRDALYLASKIYSGSKKAMKIEDAQEIGSRFTRFGNELGFYKIRINEIKNNIEGLAEGSPDRIAKSRELATLQTEETKIGQLSEQSFRQLLKGQIEFNPEPGQDGLINVLLQVVRNQGYVRMKYAFITKNPGYAPKVRSRRFVVLAYGQDESKNVVIKEVKDFDKEGQATKYAEGLQDDNTRIDILDKDKMLDRYQYFTVRAIRDLMEEANSEFSTIIDKYKTETPDGPGKDDIINTLTNLRNEYQPLQADVRDAISVRGDPFTERRKNVPGMREEDYVPNILEYMSISAVVGRKAITRAFTDLYLLQPEFDQNPQLKELTKRDRDYVLNGEKGEMNFLRKHIFYFYLGASMRHVTQNAFQIFLNGIPEMVRRGGGYMGSYNKMFKAMNLSAQYALRGTSGDKTIDGFLKSADLGGITLPDHIEAFLPTSDKADASMHLTALFGDGNTSLLEKPKWASHVAGAQLGRFFRSTAAFSETVNRRVSYLMGVLHGQEKGITDPQALFNLGQEFSDNVNFVGNKVNRPGFIINTSGTIMHGPLLVMTALRSFTINHISQLGSFWKEGKIGSYDVIGKQRRADKGPFSLFGGSFNPKNPASRALIAGLAHLVGVSGVMGLLLADDMDQLMEGLTGKSFRHWMRSKIVGPDAILDMEEESGNRLADLALGGLPAMVGMEASASLGLGRIADISAGHQATMLNNPIVGPLGGMLEKAGRGISAVARDPADPNNWEEAVRNIAPFSLTYWLRLMDSAVSNQFLDRQMKPVTGSLSDQSALPLSLGFSPIEVANTQRVKFGARRDQERQDRERRDLVNSVARLLHDYNLAGDSSVLAKAQLRFANYQSKAPGTLYDKRSLLESISLAVKQYSTPVNQAPSLAHHRLLEAHLAAYPSVKFPIELRLPAALFAIQTSQQLGQRDVALEQVRGLHQRLPGLIQSDRLQQRGLPPGVASLLRSRRTRDQNRLGAFLSDSQ